jgi:hypothetical protein
MPDCTTTFTVVILQQGSQPRLEDKDLKWGEYNLVLLASTTIGRAEYEGGCMASCHLTANACMSRISLVLNKAKRRK